MTRGATGIIVNDPILQEKRRAAYTGPPDIQALYNASATQLAAARRRRMPKDVPTIDEIAAGLAELEPKAFIAAEAKRVAALDNDPNTRYDHSGAQYDATLDFFLSRNLPYKGGSKAARRGHYDTVLSGAPTKGDIERLRLERSFKRTNEALYDALGNPL